MINKIYRAHQKRQKKIAIIKLIREMRGEKLRINEKHPPGFTRECCTASLTGLYEARIYAVITQPIKKLFTKKLKGEIIEVNTNNGLPDGIEIKIDGVNIKEYKE